MNTVRTLLTRLLNLLAGTSFLAMVALTCWQVFTRYILGRPSSWSEELVSYMFAWMSLLGASLALALPLPFLAGPAWRPAAIGALCFFVSDMMVAKGELSGLPPKFQKPVMLLYWAALYLLSWPLWAGI